MERELESGFRFAGRPTLTERPSAERLVPDLESLLGGAVQRVAEETHATSAVAWARDERGVAFRAAAFGDVLPHGPTESQIAALLALPGATSLRAPGVDETLRALAREHRMSAAVPLTVTSGDDGAQAIGALLVGLPPSRAVRPRTLATLDHAARRLRPSVTTAIAIARLADLDREVLDLTRLATLGELLAEVVHEVRNPLVSVKTFLQLLPGHLDDPDFHTNFRLVVLDETRRMERLLNSLLHQARSGAREPEQTRASLGATIESVGRLLEKRALAKDVALKIDVGADLPDAAIAEDALRQIVLNLALNAFEATPEGGRVTLAATAAGDGSRAVEFVVDDEGPGVSEEDRARLFDPFFSTRADRPGGLGLTVCSRLARNANGTIRVEDSPVGGARFRVRLPAP